MIVCQTPGLNGQMQYSAMRIKTTTVMISTRTNPCAWKSSHGNITIFIITNTYVLVIIYLCILSHKR